MKEEALAGINQVGKIGLLFTVILSLVSYIFMIVLIGAAIIIHNAPDSLATISIGANVDISMDLSEADLDSAAVETLQGYLTAGEGEAALSLGDISLYLHDCTTTENGANGSFGGTLSEFSFQELWKVVVCAVVALAATVVMLLFNGFFANSLRKCKNPFEEKVVKDAVNFSMVLVVWSVIVAMAVAVAKGMVLGAAKIGAIGYGLIVFCLVVFFINRIYKLAGNYENA